MLPKIVIWGASGHSMVIADILRMHGKLEVIGMLDDVNPEHRCVGSVPVLGGREQLPALRDKGVKHLIVGIGDCNVRARLADFAKEAGFEFETAIHPRAVVARDVEIGEGTVVMAGVVVNPGARIGKHVILNTSCSVDHECIIGDAVHIGPGVHLGGRVVVQNNVWIGIGATVLDRINIGAGSMVGAGSVVTKDVPSDVVAYGVPAKTVRSVPGRLVSE